MVCEFQTRGIYDQTFSFALHNQRSFKKGKQIIPVFGCPERKKTKLGRICLEFLRFHSLYNII